MLFCNLTPLDGRFVNAIVLGRKSDFCEYITSLHIQHYIYIRQFDFFVFTMKQIASIFCNISFARQYNYIVQERTIFRLTGLEIMIRLEQCRMFHIISGAGECLRNDDIGNRPGNVYRCDNPDLSVCCEQSGEFTCCEQRQTKYL